MKKMIIGLLILALLTIIVWSLRPITIDKTQEKIRVWIQTKAPTYISGGYDLSLRNSLDESASDCKKCFIFVYSFSNPSSGYGVREISENESPTPHLLVVRTKRGKIIEAVTDGFYDELNKQFVEKSSE